MPALISLATEADAGTWRAVLPYLQFPVIEYPGASPSCCAPEYAPADKLEASAGDFANRDGMVGGESGAPHGGAVNQ